MKTLKLNFMILCIGLCFQSQAEERKAETIVDQKKSVEENLTACNTLIRNHCGNKSNEECMKQASPKTAQVAMCVGYMMKNPMKGMGKGLHSSFQSLYDSVTSKENDLSSCLKKAKVVCGENVNVETCLISNPGAFPSFCKELMKDSMAQMNNVYENNPEMAGCTDSLMKQCPLDLSDVNETKEESMKKLQAYQDCLAQKVKESSSCKGIINSQTKNTSGFGKNTQLIR